MTHQDVINLWPSHTALGELLGVGRTAVAMMYSTDRIGARHWLAIVDAKPDKVTLRDLANHIRVDMN